MLSTTYKHYGIHKYRRLHNQNWIFPPTIADLIEEDHICRLVDDVVENIKQNRGLREFLTRGLQGVRAEFSLACIAHNLKRIWMLKSQTEAIGVNSAKNGRNDQSSLENMCRSIKGVWSQNLASFSKCLSIYQV
jgi:hypothetical protein